MSAVQNSKQSQSQEGILYTPKESFRASRGVQFPDPYFGLTADHLKSF